MTAAVKALTLMFAAALAVPPAAIAQTGGAQVQVEGAWARRAAVLKGAAGSGNSAVYAVLVNAGNLPDALVAAASDVAATVEIHESYQETGMMKMRAVEKIEMPAGSRVEMKPGGYHIMLLNLKRDLKAGDAIGVTLQFKTAGRIPVTATVK